MSGLLTLLLIAWIVYFLFNRKKSSTTASEAKDKKIEPIEYPRLFWLSLALILLGWNVFIYDTWPLIGFSGFACLTIVSLLLSFEKRARSVFVWSLSGIAILAALGIGVRANGFVQSVDLVAVVLSTWMLIFLRAGVQLEARIFWLTKHLTKMIGQSLLQLVNLFRQPKIVGKEQKWTIGGLIRTVGITVVLVLFFVWLLSEADPVFAKMVLEFREQIMGRGIATLVLAVIASVGLTLQSRAKKDDDIRLGFLTYQDLIVPTCAVVILFGVFLFVQGKYLFAGQADFATFGISYSEYVRKGFIELLAATLFGGLLSYVVILKNREVIESSKIKTLMVANSLLILELICMLGSALKRDLMYVDIYGLTRVRIIGGVFLVWLTAFLVLLLLLNIRRAMQEKILLTGMYIASCCVVLFLNIANVDQMVAAGAPSHHDYHDYFYINSLSADGISGWTESIPQIESQLATLKMRGSLTDKDKSQLASLKLAAIALQEKRQTLEEKYYPDVRQVIANYYPDSLSNYDEDQRMDSYLEGMLKKKRSWQAWNWSEASAYDTIQNNRGVYFGQLDRLVQEIKDFQRSNRIDLNDEERRLLYDFSYPFLTVDLDYYAQDLDDLDREQRNPSPTLRPY